MPGEIPVEALDLPQRRLAGEAVGFQQFRLSSTLAVELADTHVAVVGCLVAAQPLALLRHLDNLDHGLGHLGGVIRHG